MDADAENRAALFIVDTLRGDAHADDLRFAIDAAPALLATANGREAMIAALGAVL